LALVVDDLSVAKLACKDDSLQSTNSPHHLPQAFASFNSIRAGLKKFVEEQIQPGDLVALLRTSGSSGILHQFSANRRQLLALAARIEMRATPCMGLPRYQDQDDDSPLQRMSHDADPDLPTQYYTVGMLNSVEYILRGMASLPGRKSLVLLSPGFEFGWLTKGGVQALVDAAHRAAVTIYAIDPRGVQTASFTASDYLDPGRSVAGLSALRKDDIFQTQAALKFLPSQTGGRFFGNNDIGASLAKVLDDQSGYYLIGYAPDTSTFQSDRGRFHRLEVRVKRKGLHVRSRSGFLGVMDSELTDSRDAPASLNSALTSPFLENELNLTLTSLFGNSPGTGPSVRALVHLDVTQLSLREQNDQKSAEIEAVAAAFGETGLPVSEKRQSFDFMARGGTLERLIRNGMVLRVDVPIRKPGPYQLPVAVRDKQSGRVGAATHFLDVPDLAKGRLTLSGILIRGVKVKSAANAVDGQEEAANAVSDTEQAGPAVRRLRRGMWLNHVLQVYNAQLDKDTGNPRLESQVRLHRDGKEVYAGQLLPYTPPAKSDMRALVVGGQLLLANSIQPGRYQLQLSVKDQLAKPTQQLAVGWTDFEVSDHSE
jgi:VWFA-related protein